MAHEPLATDSELTPVCRYATGQQMATTHTSVAK